jgi:hypothetical protein
MGFLLVIGGRKNNQSSLVVLRSTEGETSSTLTHGCPTVKLRSGYSHPTVSIALRRMNSDGLALSCEATDPFPDAAWCRTWRRKTPANPQAPRGSWPTRESIERLRLAFG